MNDTWWLVALVGAVTVACKGVGPLALGGRALPPRLLGAVSLLAPALLAALVATQVFGRGQRLVLDERALGLLAAAGAVWRELPVLAVVVLAAAVTAMARAFGW